MSTLPLLDVMLADDSANAPDRRARVAEQMIASALTERQQIEALDACLAAPSAAEFDPHVAAVLRGMYDRWTREGEALLERIVQFNRNGKIFALQRELENAIGKTRAMLQVSLDDMLESRRQFQSGRRYTGEEIRRELGIGVH